MSAACPTASPYDCIVCGTHLPVVRNPWRAIDTASGLVFVCEAHPEGDVRDAVVAAEAQQAQSLTAWVLVDDFGDGVPSVGPFDSYEEAVGHDPYDDRFEPREMSRHAALAALAALAERQRQVSGDISRAQEVRPPESHDPATPYERAALTALNNDLSDPYPECGQQALIEAFRAGFGAARVDPGRLAEVMDTMPIGLKATLSLGEQVRWSLDQIARAAR